MHLWSVLPPVGALAAMLLLPSLASAGNNPATTVATSPVTTVITDATWTGLQPILITYDPEGRLIFRLRRR
jgi:hypothetical protein